MSACIYCGADPDATAAGRWEFFIARAPSSLNDRLANIGGKRWEYARERDEWMLWIRTARLNRRIPKATGRRRITVTRHYAGRERAFDYINLVGGAKSLVDALVREQLLRDDTTAELEDHYRQLRDPSRSGVTIIIEELHPS